MAHKTTDLCQCIPARRSLSRLCRTLLTALHVIVAFAHGDPWTLKSAVRRALDHNPQYAIAGKTYQIAQSRRKQASSQLLPSLSAQGTYTQKSPTYLVLTDDGYAESRKDELKTQEAYQVSVEQPLLLGGQLLHQYKASMHHEKAQRWLLKRNERDLVFEVREAYFGILKSQKRLEAADTSFQQLQSLLEQSQAKWKQGLLVEADYLSTKSQKASAALVRSQARNELRTAKAIFRNVLCLDSNEPIALRGTESSNECPSVALEEMDLWAKKASPELHEARLRSHESRERWNMLKWWLSPTLSASGSYRWQRPNSLLFKDFEEDWSVSLLGQWQIWDWTSKRETSFQARLAYEQAQKELEWAEQNLELQTRLLLQRYGESCERLASALEALNASERAYVLMRERLHQGMITQTEVLQSQTRNVQARVNYHIARLDRDEALAEIHYLRDDANQVPEP